MLIEVLAISLTLIFLAYKFFYSSSSTKDGKNTQNDGQSNQKVKRGLKDIPGIEPSDPELGNKPDIANVGGMLYVFLEDLHKKYGPIVRFYEGKKIAISLASPELLKQIRHLFDIPIEFFDNFLILTGNEGFSVCGVDETRRRRKIYDQHFMVRACREHVKCFLEIANEQTEKWKSNIETPIHVSKSMSLLAMTGILRTSFGDCFKDEKLLNEYIELINAIFFELFANPKEDSEEHKALDEKCTKIKAFIQRIIDDRRKERGDDTEQAIFLDVLLDMDISEGARKADITGFITGAFFTVSLVMGRLIYELAVSPEIQDKVYKEVIAELGDQSPAFETVSKLQYLRQVIDECLRLNMRHGFGVRLAETDLEIGGYFVPAGTSIYHISEPIFMNPDTWKNPEKFDPERFSKENSRGRNPYSFKPFGFAGKRKCPGQNFAYTLMTIFFAEWIRSFHFKLVPGQTVKCFGDFGNSPPEDVLVKLSIRE